VDISGDTPNAAAIGYLKEKGVVKGYDNGTFGPKKRINRYDFIKIIIQANYSLEEIHTCDQKSNLFSDVPQDQWFSGFICIAKKDGIINGYADGTFGGQNTVTLPEALKIVLETYSDSLAHPIEKNGNGNWYEPYMSAGIVNGLIQDSAENATGTAITRGDMAFYIYHIESGSDKQQSIATTKTRKPTSIPNSSQKNIENASSPVTTLTPTTTAVPQAGSITKAEAIPKVIDAFFGVMISDLKTAFVDENYPSYSDVNPSDTFFPYVEIARGLDILTDSTDGMFHPNDGLKRGEAVKIVFLAGEFEQAKDSSSPFPSDVGNENYQYINFASRLCLITAISQKGAASFSPDTPISAGDFETLLNNALKAESGESLC